MWLLRIYVLDQYSLDTFLSHILVPFYLAYFRVSDFLFFTEINCLFSSTPWSVREQGDPEGPEGTKARSFLVQITVGKQKDKTKQNPEDSGLSAYFLFALWLNWVCVCWRVKGKSSGT